MKRINLFFVIAMGIVAMIGCAGGSEPFDPSVVIPPVGTTFGISPIPGQSIGTAPGNSAVFPITVTKLLLNPPQASRAEGDVTLSITGVPAGFTASFSVNPVTPTFEGALSQLTVSVDDAQGIPSRSLPPTEFTLTISGSDGHNTRSVQTTLTVNQTTTFVIDPVADQTVDLGQIAEFPVTVREVAGPGSSRATGPVTISVLNLDSDLRSEITVNPVTPTPGGATTIVRIETAPDDSAHQRTRGQSQTQYTITFQGSDGNRNQTRTAVLTVISGS
ncbi:MAG: hypothetical protein ACAH95_00885 [Fimbriimonas sp.]